MPRGARSPGARVSWGFAVAWTAQGRNPNCGLAQVRAVSDECTVMFSELNAVLTDLKNMEVTMKALSPTPTPLWLTMLNAVLTETGIMDEGAASLRCISPLHLP